MRKPVRPPRRSLPIHRDRLLMRFSCKAPSGWDSPRPVRALAVSEHSLLAAWVPMSPDLGSRVDLPVGSAAGEEKGRGLVRCKEPAELSFSAVDREVALAAEEAV